MYFELLLYGVILFAALRISVWTIKVSPLRKSVVKKILYVFPVFEFFLWIGFVIWVLSNLLNDSFLFKPLVLGLLIVGLILLAWFVFKDFIAGLVLKTQIDLKVNDEIKISDYKGVITNIGYLALQCETEHGETELIPFSSLKAGKIVKPAANNYIVKKMIRFDVKKTLPVDELTENIRKQILNSPYCAASKQPEFHEVEELQDAMRFGIYVYIIHPKFIDKLKEDITKVYG